MIVSPKPQDDKLVGTVVRFTGTRNYSEDMFAADPVWTPIPVGTAIRIVGIESHGINPWRRYTGEAKLGGQVRRIPGLIAGKDF